MKKKGGGLSQWKSSKGYYGSINQELNNHRVETSVAAVVVGIERLTVL